ncbi:hypothetical protein BCR33DRAFT_715385 [Rhizoclosmatium globosum]|uniref:Uncharacterized protein n=1 Tax=Rhizoclosmatium globosum TaxID=329046 RepID=A0A1Y2CIZ5_9FUNG|nr:hypothetical protein BCR33DRAFT_715385 [Rhizoclosmatium globosum]|eukprot:ORY47008.1 hypothetical protein BCR33DRAFT_715385 [Rhizoclosmatium globosum]
MIQIDSLEHHSNPPIHAQITALCLWVFEAACFDQSSSFLQSSITNEPAIQQSLQLLNVDVRCPIVAADDAWRQSDDAFGLGW